MAPSVLRTRLWKPFTVITKTEIEPTELYEVRKAKMKEKNIYNCHASWRIQIRLYTYIPVHTYSMFQVCILPFCSCLKEGAANIKKSVYIRICSKNTKERSRKRKMAVGQTDMKAWTIDLKSLHTFCTPSINLPYSFPHLCYLFTLKVRHGGGQRLSIRRLQITEL